MEAFPAFYPLTGRRVVIAGEGDAAEAKARLFEGSPAEIIRVAGEEAFAPETYAGAVLAFVASVDADFRAGAAEAARSVHVPVNVVDHPAMSDFYTPAVIDRGQVVAAVGTDGASPMLASMLRNDIEARVPEGAGRVAALLRKHQGEVREALPEPHQRRAFLRDALSGPAAVAALLGEMDQASALLLEALAKGPQGQGAVRFVAGRGPADLLTLRATRVLAAADILAADAGCDPGVVALARRDAERLAPEAATTERLIELARAGHRVVRLIAGPVAPAAVKALTAAGVQVDVILGGAGPVSGLSPDDLGAILLSLKVAATATLFTLPAATAVALLLARRQFPGKVLLDAAVHLPLVLPPVATGYALLVLFGHQGVLGRWLERVGIVFAFDWTGAALAAGVMAFPLMVRPIRLSIEAIDREVDEVARTLGARPWTRFVTVTAPLAAPGIAAGAVLGFAKALGEFGATITFVAAIPGLTLTLPAAIYQATQSPGAEGRAVALCLVAASLAVAAVIASELVSRALARRLEG